MKKDFDFIDIGKKLPYQVDEDFFDNNAAIIRKGIADYEKNRTKQKHLWFTIIKVAAVIVVALLIGVLIRQKKFSNNSSVLAGSKSVDRVLKTLSDEELKQLENTTLSDPFLAIY